jgi:hypothetical protein
MARGVVEERNRRMIGAAGSTFACYNWSGRREKQKGRTEAHPFPIYCELLTDLCCFGAPAELHLCNLVAFG